VTIDDAWKRAVDIAQILSAVATLATVIVAARLWSKQFKPKLKVSISEVRLMMGHGSQDYVSVGLVNTGLVPCIVSGFQYRPYARYKARWFQIPDFTNPLSAQLPLRMEPASTNQFLLSPDQWFGLAGDMIHKGYMKSFWVRLLWKRRIRVEVLTTTGDVFVARVPKSMIKRIESEREKLFLSPIADAGF
jgi:hypothetical protein